MARMYSRKRGKSGSTRPAQRKKPSWLRVSEKEIELLISKLAKEGKSASEIGIILRDSYGVPDVKLILGKKITSILEAKKLTKELPEDLFNLIQRVIAIQKHLEANHKDMTAKRGLQLTESKIMRLIKFYKKNGKLDHTWKYDPKNLKIYAQ